MKSPLRYQMSEYDSGATAILNGISYLLDREKINPSLISSVYRFSLDQAQDNDNYQSDAIFSFISKYMNEYDKNKGYKLHFDEMNAEKLDMNFMKECTNNNSMIVVPIEMDNMSHYVTVTKADDTHCYMFDPYYMDENNELFMNNKDIINEMNCPMEYNRIISKDRLFSSNIPYSISKDKHAYVITSNYQKEGVKMARKFDYIFDTTII